MKVLNTYKNGNHFTTIYPDGTRIRETINPNDDKLTYDFPENFDICITKYCDAGCPYCHEGATKSGKHGDILNLKFIDSLVPGTEVAIGGGDALSHPDLREFLIKLKDKGVIPNITVNQFHIDKNKDLIRSFIDEKLIYGIGVSLTDSSNMRDLEIINSFGENAVIHTIAGILSEKDLPFLKNKKVLILGYKKLRRGESFFSKEVENNIVWLKENLAKIKKDIRLISFDCLAIKQLDPKKAFNISDENWEILFQGDDYSEAASTLYIDAVNMEVARSSTHELSDRIKFSYNDDDIRCLFQLSKKCLKITEE